MSLERYHSKRDFKKSNEPTAKTRAGRKRFRAHPSFVIQKHAARRLHWDLRLESNGVLKSWAVPKEPSMDPNVRRLAIEVEDHPLAYGKFEGTIPKGEYGAGSVEIWDSGTYTTTENFDSDLARGHLHFELKGKRLSGSFILQRIRIEKGVPQWILFKNADHPRDHSEELSLSLRGHLLRLSHLKKIWYPESGTTKKNVLNYYRKIAPVLIPHLTGKPLTMKRYPEGVRGEYFYEKRAPSHKPEWIKTVRLGGINFLVVSSLADLLWVANLASIELHPYLMTGDRVDTPRTLVFDLDPGTGAGILECADIALKLREALLRDRLRSFPKTSGAKGLQVYVPLNLGKTDSLRFGDTKLYAKTLAESLAEKYPRLIVSQMAKSLRTKKVLIDWSQNDQGKTTISVYSLRATAVPQVSTPVKWTEIRKAYTTRNEDLLRFGPKDVLERVKKYGDLFKPVLTLRQHLPQEGTHHARH